MRALTSVAMAIVVVVAAACSSLPQMSNSEAQRGGGAQINGAGATFPSPIYSKWFSEHNKVYPDVRINYQPIGSGGGIRQLASRTVFFGASDMPMSDEQLKNAAGPVLHVSGLVSQTPGAIGYVELIYALQNKIAFGSLQNAWASS